MRLFKERPKLEDADFRLLAVAFNRARLLHPFYLTAWVFLPDHWHAICAPKHPLTISRVVKSIKTSSTILMNRRGGESGEWWQARFFDRALRSVQEYNEKVEYVHLNPVKAGVGAASARLAMVERERIFRRERGRARAPVRPRHRPREVAFRPEGSDLNPRHRSPPEKPRTSKTEVRATCFRPRERASDPRPPFRTVTHTEPRTSKAEVRATGSESLWLANHRYK